MPRRSTKTGTERIIDQLIEWTSEEAAWYLFKTYRETLQEPSEEQIEETINRIVTVASVRFNDEVNRCKPYTRELFLKLKGGATSKLSRLQKSILIELLKKTEDTKETTRYGVKWTPDDWSLHLGNDKQLDTTAVSRALRRLEERGLITRYSVRQARVQKPRVSAKERGADHRTTHVKLTSLGILAALNELNSQHLAS